MLCPSCGHDNLEGVDRCDECLTPLLNLDVPRADATEGLARSVMEDTLGHLEQEFLGVASGTPAIDVIKQMKKAGIRAELDASDDRMQKKVRNAQMQKVPFMVIAGEEDMAAGAVSFRYRNGEQKNGIPIKEAIAEIQKVVAERTQV